MKILKIALGLLLLFSTSVYAFTPPTEEYTSDEYTRLLLHMNNDAWADDGETGHTPTAEGDPAFDAVNKKFGSHSGEFDGNDYITYPDHADWYYATGLLTIDYWIRFATDPTALSTTLMYEQYEDGSNYAQIAIDGSGKLYLYYFEGAASTAVAFNTSSAVFLAADTWYHVAVVRYGTGENNMYVFIDGDSKSLSWAATLAANEELGDIAALIAIGAENGGTKGLNGLLDEYRISKGIARDWIPPDIGNVMMIQCVKNYINNLNPDKIGTPMWSCKIKLMCWWKNLKG